MVVPLVARWEVGHCMGGLPVEDLHLLVRLVDTLGEGLRHREDIHPVVLEGGHLVGRLEDSHLEAHLFVEDPLAEGQAGGLYHHPLTCDRSSEIAK